MCPPAIHVITNLTSKPDPTSWGLFQDIALKEEGETLVGKKRPEGAFLGIDNFEAKLYLRSSCEFLAFSSRLNLSTAVELPTMRDASVSLLY